jgi:hypothetical protein
MWNSYVEVATDKKYFNQINYFSPPFGVAKSKTECKDERPRPTHGGLDGPVKWEESYYNNIHSSIHPSIHPTPTKGVFQFCTYIYMWWVGWTDWM